MKFQTQKRIIFGSIVRLLMSVTLYIKGNELQSPKICRFINFRKVINADSSEFYTKDFTKFIVLISPDSEVLIDRKARVGLNLKFGLIWNFRNIANLIFFISYANFECAK